MADGGFGQKKGETAIVDAWKAGCGRGDVDVQRYGAGCELIGGMLAAYVGGEKKKVMNKGLRDLVLCKFNLIFAMSNCCL